MKVDSVCQHIPITRFAISGAWLLGSAVFACTLREARSLSYFATEEVTRQKAERLFRRCPENFRKNKNPPPAACPLLGPFITLFAAKSFPPRSLSHTTYNHGLGRRAQRREVPRVHIQGARVCVPLGRVPLDCDEILYQRVHRNAPGTLRCAPTAARAAPHYPRFVLLTRAR